MCRHAIGIVEAIGKLYAHERTLREANASSEQRLSHRQEHCVPLLPSIKEKVDAAQAESLPGSKLGKACAYVLGQWPKLIRIFNYGDAKFHGSTGGQPIAAPIYSIIPTTTGRGYWLVGLDGEVYSFGDARFFGSTGGVPLTAPIVGGCRSSCWPRPRS